MKTAEELNKEFSIWKAKKGEKLLKLYQEKSAKTAKKEDCSAVDEKILSMENEISQREARLEKSLNLFYKRMYKAGASSDAKKARQKRTHRLCILGGLVEKAGLGDLEPPTLLGMLLQQADFLANHPTVKEKWAERGSAALNETKE